MIWLLFFLFSFFFPVLVGFFGSCGYDDGATLPACAIVIAQKRAAWEIVVPFCLDASEGAERMCAMPSCGGKPLRVDALHLAMPLKVPSVCV